MSDFKNFADAVNARVEFLFSKYGSPFKSGIDPDVLWERYNAVLAGKGLNEVFRVRPSHDCSTCRGFFRRVGGMVFVDRATGVKYSVWGIDHGGSYGEVAEVLDSMVLGSEIVDGLYLDSSKAGAEENFELLDSGETRKWDHFYCSIPSRYVKRSFDIPSAVASIRDARQVFGRGLDEISLYAIDVVLDLIREENLYRGPEFFLPVEGFRKLHLEWQSISPELRDNWVWAVAASGGASLIRNNAIGQLLLDLSSGTDVEEAVRKFESMISPANYRRPKAVVTEGMIRAAEVVIAELDLADSLPRRHAQSSDISVSDVLFVDRSVRGSMRGSPGSAGGVLDALRTPAVSKGVVGGRPVTAQEFFEQVLPGSSEIDLLVENRHVPNFMSLIAPVNPGSPRITHWENNFTWSFNKDMADSDIRNNVKSAGGNIDAFLRFSIQWNEDGCNRNDYDAHAHEPNGNHIYFGNKGRLHSSTGMLDVDIIHPDHNQVAVENLTWQDPSKMPEGRYTLLVNNYSHRGGTGGFRAEIECGGELFSFDYKEDLRDGHSVTVAYVDVANGVATVVPDLKSTKASRTVWGVATQTYVPVTMALYSPNHWVDSGNGSGNKIYMFILGGCVHEGSPRGFYNEFLRPELAKHGKVFETLASKMRVPEVLDPRMQLSGLGFAETRRNSVNVKVDGVPYEITF